MVKERWNQFEIPKPIFEAFDRYYKNCANQHEVDWDKESDLKNLDKVSGAYHVSWSSIAGTFWMTFPYYGYRVTLEITPNNYTHGGKFVTVKENQPKPTPSKSRFAEIDLV